VIHSLRRFGAYPVGKTDEVQDLDLKDLLMANS